MVTPDDADGPVRWGSSSSSFPFSGKATTLEWTADLSCLAVKVMYDSTPLLVRKGCRITMGLQFRSGCRCCREAAIPLPGERVKK